MLVASVCLFSHALYTQTHRISYREQEEPPGKNNHLYDPIYIYDVYVFLVSVLAPVYASIEGGIIRTSQEIWQRQSCRKQKKVCTS